MLILALLSTDIGQARDRQYARNREQRTVVHLQQDAVEVQPTEPAAPALPAQEAVQVINHLMANPVASASPARAQMGVVEQQPAATVMPAALDLAAPTVQLYECRRCQDRLPVTAFSSHANGQQHVRCWACNVGSSHLALLLMLICFEGIYQP